MAARKDLETYRSATRACENCGKVFARSDKPGVIYSAFMRLRFCGYECSRNASRNNHWQYFLDHISKSDAGCWNWTGPINSKGYGVIHVDGRKRYAHRYALERHVGHLGHLHALHSCDNPQCVNPGHLRPGTHRENMQDAKDRNRFSPLRGERSHRAKLSQDQVLEVLASDEAGTALAKKFNVSKSTIYAIRNRENWRHLHAAA